MLKVAPRWQAAIGLLGQVRDREAEPLLEAVLVDFAGDPDALVAAVRALGRIGDAAAVAPLLHLAARVEQGGVLPAANLQHSMGPAQPPARDIEWQVRSALADELARLGSPRPELVEAYRTDERAWVREQAMRLLDESQPARAAAAPVDVTASRASL